MMFKLQCGLDIILSVLIRCLIRWKWNLFKGWAGTHYVFDNFYADIDIIKREDGDA